MKIIYNNLLPIKGFIAINVFGVLFVRKEHSALLSSKVLNHESIHTAQMKEMLYIFFYVWYIAEWLMRLPFGHAYRNISFEREARLYEADKNYLNQRKPYSWIRLIKYK